MTATQKGAPALVDFRCPDCRTGLSPAGPRESCPQCGRSIDCLAPTLVSFLPGEKTAARAVLDWPPEFVRRLESWNPEESTPDDLRVELVRYGVARPGGGLTPLGENVRYHVSEMRWQEGRGGLDGLLDLAEVGPSVRALDVGCGAAQTLRILDRGRPLELFGVDYDPVALALGCQFARQEGVPVVLAAASAHALPFRDASFDLVLTRVALNYMHQRTALTEMARVLRPGGILFCRVERVWHDLSLIVHSPSARALVCRARDLGYGLLHELAGVQLVPGSTLRGGRAFASAGRMARILAPLGCRLLRKAESPNGPQLLGRRTQLVFIARKGPESGGVAS